MEFDNVRQILSYAVENFGCQIFETAKFDHFVRSALDDSGKWHQRNCPLKAPFVMRLVFLLILFRFLSIQNVLKMALNQLRAGFSLLSLNAITPEALCHARERLGVEPLRIFFDLQAAEIEPSALFHGLRVWGVDGAKLNVPDTPANSAHFGRPEVSRGEAAYPRMEAITLVETSTRQVVAADFTPCHSSERGGLVKLLNGLDAEDLTLMDRGFPSAWLFEEFLKRRRHFLARIPDCWKPRIVKQLEISFVQTVQIMKDTTHRLQAAETENLRVQIYYRMLLDIAECRNPRPR